ncbi:MAG: hypothetical protein Kow0069_08830 [Promethearchaeota archaeon]
MHESSSTETISDLTDDCSPGNEPPAFSSLKGAFKAFESHPRDTFVLLFSSPGCPLCRANWQAVQKLKHSGNLPNVRFVQVLIDENPSPATNFEVTGVPTVLVFREGVEVARARGLLSPKKIASLIK